MSRLEKVTHFFLIAVCCGSLALLGHNYWEQKAQAEYTPVKKTNVHPVQIGDRFNLTGADWRQSPTTVVLNIRSGCHFCQASMPFYRELVAAKQKHNSGVSVLAVSTDPPDILREYLKEGGVVVDNLVQAKPGPLGILGTPTVLMVDTAGIVRQRFIGKLSETQEKLLLTMVDTPGKFSPGSAN